MKRVLAIILAVGILTFAMQLDVLARGGGGRGGGAGAEAEADVEVAEVVPHVPAEVFPLRAEPHVRARPSSRAELRAAGRAQAAGRAASSSAEPKAVAKRPPRDRPEVAHPPHKVAPAPGSGSPRPGAAAGQRPATGSGAANRAAGSRPTSGELNKFLDVPGPATGAAGAAGAGAGRAGGAAADFLQGGGTQLAAASCRRCRRRCRRWSRAG